MMRKYRWKKIWVSNKHYSIVKVFETKQDMQEYFEKARPENENHYMALGVNMPYHKFKIKDGKRVFSNEVSTILLNKENLDIGIVTHEFIHACLWAFKFNTRKKQYPLTIRSMDEEEKLLHAYSNAITAFYQWHSNGIIDIEVVLPNKRKN